MEEVHAVYQDLPFQSSQPGKGEKNMWTSIFNAVW